MILDYNQELPDSISEQEFWKKFEEMKQGNNEAKKYLVEHNLRLILVVINKHHLFDIEDSISIGSIGLIKALDTFDKDKGLKFSTYATRCIENEIFLFLRKNNIYKSFLHLEDQIVVSKDGDKIILGDTLFDKVNIEDEYLDKEIVSALYTSISKLSDREQLILKLYYGLFGEVRYTEQQIGDLLGLTRAGISVIIIKAHRKLKKELKKQGFVDSINYQKSIKMNF